MIPQSAIRTDPTSHLAALFFRYRVAEARLNEIDERLGDAKAQSAFEASLATERGELKTLMAEIVRIVGSTPRKWKPPKLPPDPAIVRQIQILRNEVKARLEQSAWSCRRWEREGDYRQARLYRVQMIYTGDEIVREWSLDPELLAYASVSAYVAERDDDASEERTDPIPRALSLGSWGPR